MPWEDQPWHDELDARWSHVWALGRDWLGCVLFGHRLRYYREDLDLWKSCRRCNRKWDWRPAATPPAGGAEAEGEGAT